MEGENMLFDILEKHASRPSSSGMDWARENWYNLQAVSDRICVLQHGARTRAGKGKSFICAVLGAALKAAVEFRDQQFEAENQTIQSLQETVKATQELVKALQNQIGNLEVQLERERHNSALLQMAFKEILTYKDTGDTDIHGAPQEKLYPQEELKETKENFDKFETPIAPLRPLIKTEYTFDNGEDLDPQMNVKEIPFSATELERTGTSGHLQSGYKVWTWGEVAQELINYERKYGPVASSNKSEPREVRLAATTLAPRPPSPKLCGTGRVSLPVRTGRRNIDHKRNRLWTLGWQKGVPRDLMNGLPTVRLEKLVNLWPEQKPKES